MTNPFGAVELTRRHLCPRMMHMETKCRMNGQRTVHAAESQERTLWDVIQETARKSGGFLYHVRAAPLIETSIVSEPRATSGSRRWVCLTWSARIRIFRATG